MEQYKQEANKLIIDWQDVYEDFWAYFGRCFRCRETRQHAERYIRGLLSGVERKNGWQLAEYLGDSSPYAIQNFLGRAVWDADKVRNFLIQYAKTNLLEPEESGVLIVDETGFLKKGNHSVGVQRQYSGTAGRVENSQIGVFLTLASSRGRLLIDRELYLSKSWCEDDNRRKLAHIPDSVLFQTKPQLAQKMIENAYANGVHPEWILGDSIYGSWEFRNFLEDHQQSYVLGITSQQRFWVEFEQIRIDKIVKTRPEKDWILHNVGDGTKGQRIYKWISWPVSTSNESGFQRYVLARKSVKNPDEYAYYLCYAKDGTSTETLANAAGKRWNIECCFETAKQETGLDEYEVRSWHGWYRHITLSMVALAYLSVIRAACREDEAEKKGIN